MRLQAWLDKPSGPKAADGKNAPTNLDMLLQMARMRNHQSKDEAIALLERAEAPIPPALLDVYGMFVRLSVMRDADAMTGLKRMTPGFLKDGAELLFRCRLTPLEALAISQLDLAQLFPGEIAFGETEEEE